MKTYIGIDPGKTGGIALVSTGGTAFAHKMPDNERDLLDLLRDMIGEAPAPFAVLEFVRSSPQMGVTSAFTFGRGYGSLRMALAALEIPFEEVTPPKWQGALGCRSKGDKNVTKRKAQELFPSIKITHAIADALLIAEYAKRTHERP